MGVESILTYIYELSNSSSYNKQKYFDEISDMINEDWLSIIKVKWIENRNMNFLEI